MGILRHQITEALSQWADNGAWECGFLRNTRRFCKRWSMLGRLTVSLAVVLHQDSADPFVGTKETSVP